jgi:hypothetical protein
MKVMWSYPTLTRKECAVQEYDGIAKVVKVEADGNKPLVEKYKACAPCPAVSCCLRTTSKTLQ